MPDPLIPAPSTLEETPPPSAPVETPSAPSPEEVRAFLGRVDRKVLAQDPIVSGLAGDLANKQARKLAEDAQRRDREAQAAREKLAEDAKIEQTMAVDPYAGRDLLAAQRAREAQDKRIADERLGALRRAGQALQEELGLSDDEIADLRRKQYAGGVEQGFASYTRDLHEVASRKRQPHAPEAKTMAEPATEQRIKALEAELLSLRTSAEPSPDVGSGGSPGRRGVPSEAEIMKMGDKEFLSFFDEQVKAMPKGKR